MLLEAAEQQGGKGAVELGQRGIRLGGAFQPRRGQACGHFGSRSQLGKNVNLDICLGVRIRFRIQYGAGVKTHIHRDGGNVQGSQGFHDPRGNLADGTLDMRHRAGQENHPAPLVDALHDRRAQGDGVAGFRAKQNAVRLGGFQMGRNGRVRREGFLHQVGNAVPAQFLFEHEQGFVGQLIENQQVAGVG